MATAKKRTTTAATPVAATKRRAVNLSGVSVKPATAAGSVHDLEYKQMLARMQARFQAVVHANGKVLFKTAGEDLWSVYMASLPKAERQHHNCSACRHFINHYGGLVVIGEKGKTEAAMWHGDDAQPKSIYEKALSAMKAYVEGSEVTGVFMSSEAIYGTPVTGIWQHFAVTPLHGTVYRRGQVLTAGQKAAERNEDFGMVMRAFADYPLPLLNDAVQILEGDHVYRAEKVIGPVKWFRDLTVERASARYAKQRNNIVWRAIATAPQGFAHIRTSVAATLLDDLAAGKSLSKAADSFAKKMHPLKYQRPQAAPKAGAIHVAQDLVQRMGWDQALPRRFARIDDITDFLWVPRWGSPKATAQGPTTGVFSGVEPRQSSHAPVVDPRLPEITMTWEKFRRTVLPTADRVQFVPKAGHEPFTTLTTAANYIAPPLLQWDNEVTRNPVSWYFWASGTTAADYNLRAGMPVDVHVVCLKPNQWHGNEEKYSHHGKAAMFVLNGARDKMLPSACLFPEQMRSELHGVRSVIEAYSSNKKMIDPGGPVAAGVMLQAGKNEGWDAHFVVTAHGRIQRYKLDRWD